MVEKTHRPALIRLTAAAWLLCLAPGAMAQESRPSGWSAYMTRTPEGQALCAVSSQYDGGREFYIKWFKGSRDLVVQLFKSSWAIPANETGEVVFKLNRGDEWAVHTRRIGRVADFVEFGLTNDQVRSFTTDFTGARSMVIQFTSGTDLPWLLDLTGNSAAVDEFARCIAAVAGPGSTSHPFAYLRQGR